MKKTLQLLALLVITAIVYSGCEKSKSLLDVKFDADFKTDLNVDVPGVDVKISPNGVFSASATIDPMTNDDFAEYAEKIKNVKVKEVLAEVTAVNKPFVLLHCNLLISSPGYDTAEWIFMNESMAVGKIFTLGNEAGQWDKVQTMLDDKKELTVSMNGETDEDDVEFTLRITIKTEVTANPL